MMVVLLSPRAGGAGFLVEEEADFRKFPNSHLPFLPGRGRGNEMRKERVDECSQGQVSPQAWGRSVSGWGGVEGWGEKADNCN